MTASPPIRVVLIDDHEMVAEALALALESGGVEILGRAGSLAEGIELVQGCDPDVVLLDYRLPDADGVGSIAALRRAAPRAQVVVVTAVADDRTAAKVLEAGAAGYLTKDLAVRDLVGAVLAAAAGETVVAPNLVGAVLGRMRSPLTQPGATLTRREREVLGLLARGSGVDEVAAALGPSRHTVRKHVQAVLYKLGAHSQLEAVAIARRERLVEED